MGGEWDINQLGDVATNHDARRQPVKESDRRPGPYPYYGASGVVDWVDSYNFDGDYVLIAEDGENLRTRQTPIAFPATGKFWVNNHAHVLSGSSRITTRFLLYALLAADIAPFITGAVMPKLTQASLNRIQLTLPTRREQERITELLGSLDDKIEMNRRMVETLEATTRALFKSWFVDFTPVHARAERRPIVFSGKLDALFADSFGANGSPNGWVAYPISKIASIVKGNSYKSEHLQPAQTSLVTLKSFARGGGYRHEGLKPFIGPFRTDQVILPGELLVAATDVTQAAEVIGQPIIVEASVVGQKLVASLDTFIIRPSLDGLTPVVLEGLLRAASFPKFARGYCSGTTVLHLSSRVFDDFSIFLPDTNLLQALTSLIAPLHERRLLCVQQSMKLAFLRDNLLSKLISGELRIADAEQRVAAA